MGILPLNASLNYAAASYLNEWMWLDQRFNASLRHQTDRHYSQADCQCLVEMAKAYGINAEATP